MLRVDYEELEPSEDYLIMLYEGQPFNGVAFELGPNGEFFETSFEEGQKGGMAREWSPSGVLILEEHFKFGGLHGLSRTWHENGHLKSEGTYEWGVCTRKQEWDEHGRLAKDYTIDPTSPEFGTLKLLRAGNLGRLAGDPS